MLERMLTRIKALVGGSFGQAFGWRSLFYFAATCNLVCAILFFILVRDTPRTCYQLLNKIIIIKLVR